MSIIRLRLRVMTRVTSANLLKSNVRSSFTYLLRANDAKLQTAI